MLQISPELLVPEQELVFSAMRASGPGGQHVNTADTAMQLRFDIRQSPSLPEPLRQRLLQRRDRRITADGVLVLRCDLYRSRERNRQELLERLRQLLLTALHPPRPRKATRPSRAAVERRLQTKQRQGQRKAARKRPSREDRD